MSPWARRTGIGLGAVLLLFLGTVATVYAVSARRFARVWAIPASGVAASRGAAAVARGYHLATAIGKCGDCHGPDLGGALLRDDATRGRLAAPNLTPGRGGIRGRTDADLERAIRHGVGAGGRPLFFMPAEAFYDLSDADLGDLLAYLRSLPPVDREWPAPRIGPMARALYLTAGYPLIPAELVRHDAPRATIAPGDTVAYGRYLATIGGCRSCHGDRLRGDGMPGAPDLTRTRLGRWTRDDFVKALRTGTRPDGSSIGPEMPWVASGRMTDPEIYAVWSYLRALPPSALPGR